LPENAHALAVAVFVETVAKSHWAVEIKIRKILAHINENNTHR
jgi:hypothetical protein